MKTVCKTSVFPASRDLVFSKLQELKTLQYIAVPYATFAPTDPNNPVWVAGSTTSYRFRLFGIIPFGTHVIHIERFDMDTITSKERNEHVLIWNHNIYLKEMESRTEYTDKVDIDAGWKTSFIYLWAKAFFAHRQRKWIRMLETMKQSVR